MQIVNDVKSHIISVVNTSILYPNKKEWDYYLVLYFNTYLLTIFLCTTNNNYFVIGKQLESDEYAHFFVRHLLPDIFYVELRVGVL